MQNFGRANNKDYGIFEKRSIKQKMMICISFIAANDYNYSMQLTEQLSCFLADK